MRMFVFLDDERVPEDVTWHKEYLGMNISWVVLRTYKEFKEFVDSLLPSQINDFEWGFDHDIQDFSGMFGQEMTGKTCLEYLLMTCIDNDIPMPICHFHTQNPVGKDNMEALYLQAMRLTAV